MPQNSDAWTIFQVEHGFLDLRLDMVAHCPIPVLWSQSVNLPIVRAHNDCNLIQESPYTELLAFALAQMNALRAGLQKDLSPTQL